MRRSGVLAVVAAILFLAAPQAVVTASGPVSVAPPSQHHVVKSSGISSAETAVACSGPAQISPVDAATVPSETVTLSWNDVSGCTFAGYTLRVRTDADFDGDPSLNLVDMGVAATLQEVTIPSGHRNQALYWAVKAANAPDGAAWSSRTFQIVPPTVPSSAPTAPTDIAATTLSIASIRVTWADNSNNEDGFRVYRWSALDGPDWMVPATRAADTTTFTDTGLQPSTRYYYFACGFNAGGEACASLQLDAKTLSAVPVKPVAPTNVSATTVGSTSIRFIWADNSDNEDGFRVYRWSLPDGGKQWVVATTTAPDVTTFLDTGLQLSAEYFYFACAYNAAGEACATGAPGWLSATTTDGLPTAPRTVTASPANTAAQVSWSAPTSDGGLAITAYVATSFPGGRTCATS